MLFSLIIIIILHRCSSFFTFFQKERDVAREEAKQFKEIIIKLNQAMTLGSQEQRIKEESSNQLV